MKVSLNNREKRVEDMLVWLNKTRLLHSISTDTKRIVEGYAVYMTKQSCRIKYGKVDKSLNYYKRQLGRQKIFAIMTLNIICKIHSIPNKLGYVYIVSNPAYPGWYKVGAAKDAETRLLSYQTGSPFRDYKLEWYLPCEDYVKIEKEFHNNSSFSHEWVKAPLETVKQMLRSSRG
ncbi:hypothetical protein PONTUS_93 [Vibrio phage Pontus]|uniref:Bacteriophage T5 Orf172 DNA-binding domain-containing protein n=1 Tax=Vibrio phage Pontus TaxID=2590874 RepID=A0A4Y6E917_9CAUD|nr:hypothetical protein KNU59_gp188 [Vibrio phage Pontus]QDF14740.1 hypothetical protein PONTUS_93 [Vibrio phage Pontus]